MKSAVSVLSPGLVLIDLSKIRGRAAVCARIPDEPGVYSWFRRYDLPPPATSNADEYATYLLGLLSRPHCLPRIGSIRPLFEVELRSRRQPSERKSESLRKLCQSPSFREVTAMALDAAIFFEQPLYVGKASRLAERIAQHLAPESDLRLRLQKVDICIDRSLLLYMVLPASPDPIPGDSDVLSAEQVLEDLLSRLFHPLFTARYG